MMLLVIVTSFVSATTYALCFPSLAPYLVELYPQAGQLLLGLSVAIFSLTKALAAPIVGRVVGAVGTQAPLVALVLLLAASQVRCSTRWLRLRGWLWSRVRSWAPPVRPPPSAAPLLP